MAEEFTHLRKSKPVLLAAGLIWALIAWVYQTHPEVAAGLPEHAVRHNLLEYAELMLFLLVAMTYINAMDERQVFEALRSWLVKKGFGFRKLFWITGVAGLLHLPGGGQPDHGAADVRRGAGGGRQTTASSCCWPASTSWWRPTPAAPSARSATSPP